MADTRTEEPNMTVAVPPPDPKNVQELTQYVSYIGLTLDKIGYFLSNDEKL